MKILGWTLYCLILAALFRAIWRSADRSDRQRALDEANDER